ncbi:MAG: hypothetical protein ACFFED_14345 [Candidatus Thorarchaeota archaeon]
MLSSKPYWDEPLVDRFEVTVLSVERNEDGYRVSIDKDVIRAEGGGQAGDRGSIGEARISNTILLDNHIFLLVDRSLEEGSTTTLMIDMEWRRASMRNHTAEHILVKQLKQQDENLRLGYIWIDGDQGTVDIEGQLNEEMIFQAEKHVQEIIFSDKQVRSSMVASSELSDLTRAREGLDSKYERLRVVTIDGIDDSACSGIHVISTGDIGYFKITEMKKEGKITRIQFLTHLKAVSHVGSIYNEVLSRKTHFPFEMEQIGSVLDKSKRSQEERNEMIELIRTLLTQTPQPYVVNDQTLHTFYLPGFEAKDLKQTLKALPSDSNTAILLFAPGRKTNFLFWTYGLSHDASYYVRDVTERLGGKGGGSKDSFTGGFAEAQDPASIFNELVSEIKDKLG